jgi:hypothetical protein
VLCFCVSPAQCEPEGCGSVWVRGWSAGGAGQQVTALPGAAGGPLLLFPVEDLSRFRKILLPQQARWEPGRLVGLYLESCVFLTHGSDHWKRWYCFSKVFPFKLYNERGCTRNLPHNIGIYYRCLGSLTLTRKRTLNKSLLRLSLTIRKQRSVILSPVFGITPFKRTALGTAIIFSVTG